MGARGVMVVLHECVKVFIDSFPSSFRHFTFGIHATSVNISDINIVREDSHCH